MELQHPGAIFHRKVDMI